MKMIHLTEIEDFDFRRIVFSEPQYNNNNNSIIIKIGVSNANNDSIHDLVISSPQNMLSFGLQEIREKDADTIVAYQLPLCFHHKSKWTNMEAKFVEFINKFTDICHDVAKQELSSYNSSSDQDITFIHPIVYKKQANNENVGPIMYVKMLLNRYSNQFISVFIDEKTNQEVDPLLFLNKKSFVTAAIKLESIIIGKKITLRMKLYEVVIREFQSRYPGKNQVQQQKMSILRPDKEIVASVKSRSRVSVNPKTQTTDNAYVVDTTNSFDMLEQDV